MTDKTDTILELLAETDAALSKRGIEINLQLRGYNLSYSTIKDHIRLAEATGLVEEVEQKGAWYTITTDGRKYLEGTAQVEKFEQNKISSNET